MTDILDIQKRLEDRKDAKFRREEEKARREEDRARREEERFFQYGPHAFPRAYLPIQRGFPTPALQGSTMYPSGPHIPYSVTSGAPRPTTTFCLPNRLPEVHIPMAKMTGRWPHQPRRGPKISEGSVDEHQDHFSSKKKNKKNWSKNKRRRSFSLEKNHGVLKKKGIGTRTLIFDHAVSPRVCSRMLLPIATHNVC